MDRNLAQPKQTYALNGERYVVSELGQLIPLIKEVIEEQDKIEKYFTCEEVAEKYGVKKITVWSWIREKKLNAIQTGKVYRIRLEDLREFEGERKTKIKTKRIVGDASAQ